MNISLIFHLLISVCLKPFKFTYMEMKIFENTFPPYEDIQILHMLFTSHITPHTTLGILKIPTSRSLWRTSSSSYHQFLFYFLYDFYSPGSGFRSGFTDPIESSCSGNPDQKINMKFINGSFRACPPPVPAGTVCINNDS